MSGWLRNLQGQLTELASEVLSEATEEVQDPESELQVEKKKCSELERRLVAEQANTELLERKLTDLGDQLYEKNLEIETITAKYSSMIDSRDNQIRNLQVELERARHASSGLFDEDDDEGLLPKGGTKSARMKEEIEHLKKEVQHWKRIVNDSSKKDQSQRILELERKLSDQRNKGKEEMAALIQVHNENICRLRAEYEQKINKLEFGIKQAASEEASPCLRRDDNTSDDWQKGWDDAESDSSLVRTAGNETVDRLREENRRLLNERDKILLELSEIRSENAKASDEVNELTLHAVDAVLNEKLEEAEAECSRLRQQNEAIVADLESKNVEVSNLQAQLKEMHSLIDLQREKFEQQIEKDAKMNSELLEEAKNEVEKIKSLAQSQFDSERLGRMREEIANLQETIKRQGEELMSFRERCEKEADKDRELAKLTLINSELTAAYNDLNEEYESHKAEHGAMVNSNHDLICRIDALKANLIEYEERYELCKAENAETVQQLEKLTNDFERLRLSFESSKGKSNVETVEEVQRLREELESSREERERLRGDVTRFRNSIETIDSELNRLRESNAKLAKENVAMSQTLDKFTEIRDMLDNSDCELKNLREKLVQLQQEHQEKEKVWEKTLAAETEAREEVQKELEECRLSLTERESALQRYRSVVGAHAADIVEMKSAEGKSSSEGTTDSNSGWERMVDWDGTGNSTSTGTGHQGATVMEELREALAMITEKTEECEELRKRKSELEHELEMSQNCFDELMAQTNALQSQQQLQAESFSQLREWGNEKEREKLEAERAAVYAEEKLKEAQLSLDKANEEIDSLQKNLSNVLGAKNELNEQVREMESKYDEAVLLLEASRKEAAEAMESQKMLKAQFEASHSVDEKQLNDLRNSLTLLEEKTRNMEKARDEATVTNAELTAELQTLQKNLNIMLAEKNALIEQVRELESKRDEVLLLLEISRRETVEAVECRETLKAQLEASPLVDEKLLNDLRDKLRLLEEETRNLEHARDEATTANAQLTDELQTTRSSLAEAERVRGELVILVEQKHAESLNYHSQLQKMFAEKEANQAELQAYAQKISSQEQQLISCVEAKDKFMKECERLRQHLMAMEEASTSEAVAAEERETSLRKKIRELELKTEESADTVISSTNAYQRQISELSNEIEAIKAERDEFREKLRDKECTLIDTQKALSNLQKVLRDLGVDHELQLAKYEEEIADLKADIEKLEGDVVALRETEKALISEKQALEDSTIHLKEEVSRRDTVIDELETQLDERAQAAGSSSSSTYHIDDQTLRQLFLSYFTADRDKRPEIAMLLASVLGYPPEDIVKIQAANQSASRGWFGLGGSPRVSHPTLSIAEQFVRFLEKESVTASTSHSLPVEAPTDRSTIRSSTLPPNPARPSDVEDLRYILDT